MADNPNASEGRPTAADWRELAQRIQHETDSKKMIELVQQLLDRYDEEKRTRQGNLLPPENSKSSGSPDV